MSLRRPLDVHLTLGGFTITSKASPNWTSRDVQFGRTYLVAFGPSNGRPLDALIGRPLVRNRRPLDVLRTSLCPLGLFLNKQFYQQTTNRHTQNSPDNEKTTQISWCTKPARRNHLIGSNTARKLAPGCKPSRT